MEHNCIQEVEDDMKGWDVGSRKARNDACPIEDDFDDKGAKGKITKCVSVWVCLWMRAFQSTQYEKRDDDENTKQAGYEKKYCGK